MIVRMLTVSSFFGGVLLSSYQYQLALKRRYVYEVEFEEVLIQKYRAEIRA